MDPVIELTRSSVSEVVTIAGQRREKAVDPNNFYRAFGVSEGHFDTGIMPLNGSGVLSVKRSMGYLQITFQQEAGIYPIIVGDRSEGDEGGLKQLAQPNRVIIADFHNGELLGARHFYTRTPVWDKNAVLHHVNLPNLNCFGYGQTKREIDGEVRKVGVGVGWICLYHNKSCEGMTFGELIRYVVERAGGLEAYNGNMTSTDGTALYSKYRHNERHLWDWDVWATKTAEEGYAWVHEAGWVPVLVNSMDDQCEHVEDGVPLTLGMAMDGAYFAYYPSRSKEAYVKPFNQLGGYIYPDPDPEEVFTSFRRAITAAPEYHKAVRKPPKGVTFAITDSTAGTGKVAIGVSAFSGREIYTGDQYVRVKGGIATFDEAYLYYCLCSTCKQLNQYSDLGVHITHEGVELICPSCAQVYTCLTCGATHLDPTQILGGNWCTACEAPVSCDACGNSTVGPMATHVEDVLDGAGNSCSYTLCETCTPQFEKCNCKRLVPQVAYTPQGDRVCPGCGHFDPATGIWQRKIVGPFGISMTI